MPDKAQMHIVSDMYLVADWAHKHFRDGEYGEWFGYLHRDGSISSEIKGEYV